MSVDPHSSTWQAVAAAIKDKLLSNLKELETPGKEPRRSDELRGANADLRDILKLGQPVSMAPHPKAAPDESGYPIV